MNQLSKCETLPHSDEAEKSLIYIIINDESTLNLSKALSLLKPEFFWNPVCSVMFEDIAKMAEAGKDINSWALMEFYREQRNQRNYSVASYSEIISAFTSSTHFESSLSIVQEKYARREILTKAQKILDEGAHEEMDRVQEIADSIACVNSEVTQGSKGIVTAKESCRQFLIEFEDKYMGKVPSGIKTGIQPLDFINAGMGPGQVWVIGGETSAGKSVLALQIAGNVAMLKDVSVQVFSMEMNRSSIVSRLVSCFGHVEMGKVTDPQRFTSGKEAISRVDQNKITRTINKIAKSNLIIDDSAEQTVQSIRAAVKLAKAEHNVKVVVVDYLQLMTPTTPNGASREQQVASFSRGMKLVADENECTVISLTQLNDDGKVRESRAIMNDAHVGLKITENGILVAKNREGKKGGVLPLFLNGLYQKFEQREIQAA